MRKPFNFTMGADPEFNIIMQNKRINASQTITQLYKDLQEGNANMGFKVGHFGEIGWDGANATGELRPSPANTADELTENIKQLFKKLYERMPLFELSTLSYFGSVGGHIHFSIPSHLNTRAKINGAHKKLASFYLPIMFGENKINLQIRKRSSYGQITDHREERHGDGNTYEFRTPSAEWLTSEKITRATLAYLGTVYNEIVFHPRKMSKCSDLFYTTEKQGLALQDLALSDYKSLIDGIFKKTKKYIKDFEFYKEYEEEIEYILNPKQILKDKSDCQYEIIKGWKFDDTKKNLTKKTILNEKKTKDNLTKMNIESLQGLSGVYYNPDINVEYFQKTLGEKIYAFNWKLKHNYFLFGLKKGIDSFIVLDIDKNIYHGKELITAEDDIDTVRGLCERMTQKYRNISSNSQYTNADLMKIVESFSKQSIKKSILIGIPYQMRLDHKPKDFISLIYELEKKLPTPIAINEINRKEIAQKGGTLTSTQNKESGIVFDDNSNSYSRMQDALMSEISELQSIRDIEERENIDIETQQEEHISERLYDVYSTIQPGRIRVTENQLRELFMRDQMDVGRTLDTFPETRSVLNRMANEAFRVTYAPNTPMAPVLRRIGGWPIGDDSNIENND